jgi:hypothetical protein
MRERGEATRGKVAKAVAGAEAIEIKATVPHHQVEQALARFGLTTRNDEERLIYFFDTPRLDLLESGIIARARRVIGEQHDSTVKVRPVQSHQVGARWRKYRDFKIEVDASEKGMVKSASFSMPVAKGLIKRVVAGDKPIGALFTAEQEDFLEEMVRRQIDFASLAVLGPLKAQRWTVEDPASPWPITSELWRRADGQQLMEVSIKAPIVQAAAAIGGFMAYLAEFGAERDASEQTKTRWALGHYAGPLAGSKAVARRKRSPSSQRKAPARPARRRT